MTPTTPEDHRRIAEMFSRVVELPDDLRGAELDALCGGDAPLRAAVADLLRANAGYDRELDGPALPVNVKTFASDSEPVPARIGPFDVVSVIGRGGMGVVYLAQQQRPRRRVAVKVLRFWASTPRNIRRFEHETEILGLLQHPGIAQIYETGMDIPVSSGAEPRPYFAMEFIDGQSITDHTRGAVLATDDRLRLFLLVCDAVQFAHSKGVIHRDLKPGNVLVDHQGRPKILDFGVARVSQQDVPHSAGGTGGITEPGHLVGTLEYMSPEQAAGSAGDIDTRSDVYSLGLVLYELLSERPAREFAGQPMLDALLSVRDRPVTPLRSAAPHLDRDLETIVETAVQRDRERRYPSASALAADIRRYLGKFPIEARPASAVYHFRKFASRHRGVTAAVAVAALAVAALGVSIAVGVGATLRETARARRAESAAKDEADARLAAIRLFRDVLKNSDPEQTKGTSLTVPEALRARQGTFDAELAANPMLRATLGGYLGELVQSYGDLSSADRYLSQCFDACKSVYGADSLETAGAMDRLASLRIDQDDAGKAAELYRAAAKIYVSRLGPDDRETLNARQNIALALRGSGDLTGALQEYRSVLADEERALGAEDLDTTTVRYNVAELFHAAGRFGESLPLAESVVRFRERELGAKHPDTLSARNLVGCDQLALGLLDEASRTLEACFIDRSAVLTADHLATMSTQNSLLACWLRLAQRSSNSGSFEKIEQGYGELLRRQERVLGAESLDAVVSRINLAETLLASREYAEAASLCRESLPFAAAQSDTIYGIVLRTKLGRALLGVGNPAEAKPELEQAVTTLRASAYVNTDHHRAALRALEEVSRQLGQPDDAARYHAEADAMSRTGPGP